MIRFPPPTFGDALSFPLEEVGADQTNPRFFCDLFCDYLAIFLRFPRQNLQFCPLRFENATTFLRLRFFGTLSFKV